MKNKDKEYLERTKFLEEYNKFNEWLSSIGFRKAHHWNEKSIAEYHYSHYDKYINSLFGVEHCILDPIKLSIIFMRDRFEHKFMFVGDLGSCSEVYNIEEMKEQILIEVRKLRDEKLTELSSIAHL